MKGLKKALAFVIALAMLLTALSVPALADMSFTDINESHWAYSFVMQLVNDGTVKGYEDGSFRPEGTVTRAEFVKMIGEGPVVRQEAYTDVPQDHWGYAYIMSSGLKTEGNEFLPDKAITRGEVLELLWSRNGEVKDVVAPGAIKKQCETPDAAAWGYTYGIMIGDDGLNLRLEENLTRAEAATLIIRGRNYAQATPIDYEKTISDDMIRLTVLESNTVDGDVSDLSRVLTNGELAYAAARIITNENEPLLVAYPASASDCKYGHEWAYIASDYLGNTDFSEGMVNKNATLVDGVAAVSMAVFLKSKDRKGIKIMGAPYKNIEGSGKMNLTIRTAHGMGVQFNSNDTLDTEREFTLRDLGVVLTQLDKFVGLKYSYKNTIVKDEPIQKDFSKYPSSWQQFPTILEAVPAYVYDADWGESYTVDYEIAKMFVDFVAPAIDLIAIERSRGLGERLNFTVYPSLISTNKNGYIKVRAHFIPPQEVVGKSLKEVFGDYYVGEDEPAAECFLEFVSKTPANSDIGDAANYVIKGVVK